MKKNYSSIVFVFLLQNIMYGQSTDTFRRWQFGGIMGPHFTMQVPKFPGSDQRGGIMAAVDISYALQNSGKGWSLRFQPGVNRWRTDQVDGKQGSDYYLDWKWKSTTINLPLVVRYTILEGKFRPFAEIGVSYVARNYWKVKGSGTICLNGTCDPLEFEDKDNGNFDKGRFSALAGVGMEFDLGKVTIPVMLRWNEQLKKIERIDDPATGLKYTIPRSRAIQLTTGVTF